MLSLDDVADFTWDFGSWFFLETDKGNFQWNDPEYGGTNTITKFDGTYQDWIKSCHIPYGRGKGKHVIRDYCGPDVKIVG